MSTVGTLYDETVKFGYGKLLQTSTASGAASIDFVAPLALDYDTFWFDLDSLTSAASQLLQIFVSINSGSTWITASGTYWYTFLYQPGGSAAASYSSSQLGGAETTYMRIGQPLVVPAGAYPMNGRVYFNLGPNRGVTGGHRQFDWITIGRDGTGYTATSTGGGASTGTAPNGVRFSFAGNAMTGTIRCYGLKKGQGA